MISPASKSTALNVRTKAGTKSGTKAGTKSTSLVPPSKLLDHLRSLPLDEDSFKHFDEYERHFKVKGYKEGGDGGDKRKGGNKGRGNRGGGVDREVICLNIVLEKTSRLRKDPKV